MVKDRDYVVQSYVTGICCGPTTMAFVGNDILVLQKVSGEVHVIRDGRMQETPVLKENVTTEAEQGMLSIATLGNKVYLYFTESSSLGGPPLGKRVYSYDWNGERLVNKTLIKDMPQTQTYHNGGGMTFDKNGTLYIIVGDAGRFGKLENNLQGEPDDTAVVQQLVPPGPYYAMGIRNSFGLTTDPVTGAIWDTENGVTCCDEINIVPPKFNSGWNVVMGPANSTQLAMLPKYQDYVYHDPQFTWERGVAPTGIAFPNSEAFAKYKNSVFVGDFNNGNLYGFELNATRTGFVFNSTQLKDDVAKIGDSMNEITFGKGFGPITDVKFGPDGLLYIVSYTQGTIYRIVPSSMTNENLLPPSSQPGNYSIIFLVAGVGGAAVLGSLAFSKFRRRSSN